ncbi:hypothetical protein GCM10027569_81590 [Flindersiella endophytica]
MEVAVLVGLAVMAVVAVMAFLCFAAYLLFLRFVINKTGSTESLRDVATAIRAYKVPIPTRNGGKTARR